MKAPIDVLGLSNGARSGLTGFVAGVARSSSPSAASPSTACCRARSTPTACARRLRPRSPARRHQSIEAFIDDERSGRFRRGASARIEEFGAVCAFLCSVHAGYITGQNLLMDGGAYPGTF